MQRTDAAKWFWPFMLVAAVSAATIIALPPFQAKSVLNTAEAAAVDMPQFRMQMTVLGAREPHVADRNVVAIQPYRIQVIGKRLPAALDGSRDASLQATRADARPTSDRPNCTPL